MSAPVRFLHQGHRTPTQSRALDNESQSVGVAKVLEFRRSAG